MKMRVHRTPAALRNHARPGNAARLALFACAALLAGSMPSACTSYHLANPAEVPQGAPVRAILAEPVDVPLENVTVRAAHRVDGEMVRVAGEDLLVSAYWVVGPGDAEYPARGETVALPAVGLARLERKRISWWKTGGAVAGLALGGFLVEQALTGAFGRGSGGGGGRPQPR